eukprot:CAMPEP_0117441044 /NCGR_PEP_ID=MMETSP0759-20121206/3417_1 /TAXON_ID=63605 /ORGANISM="Percolomonas cosmopolitus, Strain WS" /LENGTH=232 /DNA_ID=CAMNT_0005232857 /DNA_START=7 /DNA_END=705 /DNA_ORIENTATION=+
MSSSTTSPNEHATSTTTTTIISSFHKLTPKKCQKPLTLIFIIKKQKILLAMKKRGFGMGRWNGFGGKIEAEKDASVREGALRELHEESFIHELPKKAPFNCIGRIFFNFQEELEKSLFVVWVFCCVIRDESDEQLVEEQLRESEEMKPQWFAFDEIPYDSMWPDDKLWVPILLENAQKKDNIAGFEAFFDFPESFDEIGEYVIDRIPNAVEVFQEEMKASDLGRITKIRKEE